MEKNQKKSMVPVVDIEKSQIRFITIEEHNKMRMEYKKNNMKVFIDFNSECLLFCFHSDYDEICMRSTKYFKINWFKKIILRMLL